MSKELKYHLENFDLDYLNLVERKLYDDYRSQGNNKIASLLQLMKNNDLSYDLNELKSLVFEYDKTLLN